MKRSASRLPAALIAVAALAACPGADGPADEAVDEYLARNGVAVPAAAEGDPGDEPQTPVARRVALTVESGTGLYDTDDGPGETDPYVIVEYEGYRYETSVVEGSLEPVWGDSFVFDIHPGGILSVTLMDEDALFSSDEKLGVVSRPLAPLRIGQTRTLELAFRGGEMGTVTLSVTGLPRP